MTPASFSARARSALAVGLAALACVAWGVMARDLPKQLRLSGVDRGTGLVAYGEILSSQPAVVADGEVPFTRIALRVDRVLAGQAEGVLTVFVPGDGEHRLSISPPESLLRPGEQVLVFLRADEALRTEHPGAFKLDSFAEIFRTQRNAKGEVIVLGQGTGAAVSTNVRLDDLHPVVRDLAAQLQSAPQPEDGR